MSEPGQVIVEEYIDLDLPRSIPYRVYLPPCYQAPPAGAYPVLVLLHGLLFTDGQWDELGVNEAADDLIRSGAMPPAVIVMPWERKGLDSDSAVTETLLPHIRAAYAGAGDHTNTAIGGLSRGAGWALRIGLKHPGEFGAIGLHSPAVIPPDLYFLPDWIEAARDVGVPRLWIDFAERDTSRAGAQELASVLAGLGLTYAASSAPGEHASTYWSSRVPDYLTWYGLGWGEEAMR
jgi:enterochelin esterase-like enzyme